VILGRSVGLIFDFLNANLPVRNQGPTEKRTCESIERKENHKRLHVGVGKNPNRKTRLSIFGQAKTKRST
jgi:hypothetical protein